MKKNTKPVGFFGDVAVAGLGRCNLFGVRMTKWFVLLCVCCGAATSMYADVTDREKESIEKYAQSHKAYVQNNSKINIKLIDDEGLRRFSSMRLFKVNIVTQDTENISMTTTFLMLKEGDEMQRLKMLSTTEPCEQLMKIFDKGVVIKSDQDAKLVEAALDVIYQVSSMDQKHKEIFQDGDQWIFIRDDMRDKFKAFQFTVDDKGTVTAIHYTKTLSKE